MGLFFLPFSVAFLRRSLVPVTFCPWLLAACDEPPYRPDATEIITTPKGVRGYGDVLVVEDAKRGAVCYVVAGSGGGISCLRTDGGR